jgi:pyridoxamine 5'-phosphate oxidase
MSNRLEPAHHNNLDAIIPAAWSPPQRGVSDRKSGSHILQVATINTDGLPTIRSVVLRAFEEQTRTLRFHTDFRSEKDKEIFDRPQIAIHIYDRVEKAQLRLRCRATLHHRDSQSAGAWRSMPDMSSKCYGQIAPTGNPLDSPTHANNASTRVIDDAYDNFAVVSGVIQQLEWLYLSASGHRRALVRWRNGKGIKTSLAP